MSAYYSEHDPFAAAWLRELIKAGLIADGEVDERDIQDVQPGDLAGFTQCHFFAGIAGWSYALRLAGWADDRPVWTGSCPCQPWSVAGANQGSDDSRDLWPTWRRLIAECRPVSVFGEQVASADAVLWIDRVAEDMEGMGYALGAFVLPASSVGAPHRRDRFYFVADADSANAERRDSFLWRDQGTQQMGLHWAFSEWQGGLVSSGGVDDGISDGVAKRIINGYGNAIVPQVAAQFIGAYLDTLAAPRG